MIYNTRLLINKKDKRIDKFIEEFGTIYHLTEWSEVIKKVFNHNVYYIYVENDEGEVCGVLPLVNINSRLFGNYMVSMPFFNYGGLVAENKDIESLLLEEAIEQAKKHDVDHIELREEKERDDSWPVRTDKVNMILDLPETVEMLSKLLGSKRRSQIKRPLREGIEVFHGGVELLNDFYSVFSENMRDLGTPVYSKDFFKEILQTFSENSKLIILRLDNKPISAAFLLGYRNQLEIPWASTLMKYNSFSPNMLLYWEVLKYAVEQGYKKFDFGRSSIDSGTYRFKKQWGAKPMKLYWHYWLANGMSMPELTPNNPKYKLAIKIWQRMPLVLTNFLGPKIVKNLP